MIELIPNDCKKDNFIGFSKDLIFLLEEIKKVSRRACLNQEENPILFVSTEEKYLLEEYASKLCHYPSSFIIDGMNIMGVNIKSYD